MWRNVAFEKLFEKVPQIDVQIMESIPFDEWLSKVLQ